MTFPTNQTVNTTHLDSPDDDPSLARGDLYTLVTLFNQIVTSVNSAQGILVLDGSGQIAVNQIPVNLAVTGDLTLQPSTKVVKIQDVLRLQPRYTADNVALTPTTGDMIYLVDGDAGGPCLSVYDGSNWRVVRLMTTVGDAGAALLATTSLVATAV